MIRLVINGLIYLSSSPRVKNGMNQSLLAADQSARCDVPFATLIAIPCTVLDSFSV